MTRIGYPSEDFPNPVPFFIDIPDDWSGLHLPQTLVAARAPEPVQGYRANVVVTWQRIALEGDIEDLARAIVDRSSSEGRTIDPSTMRSGAAAGLPIATFEATVSDGESTEVAQTHVVVAGPPTGRSRDLFHVVGTCALGADAGADTIGEILGSLVVLDPGAAQAPAA